MILYSTIRMAAAGAGGGGGVENIHNVITSAPSPLPANVMSRIASFVPNWRKMPEFNAFKNKSFHQTPFEIVEKIKAGDQVLLMAYLDYLNSPEFHAARVRYAPERPGLDRQILINDLLCDTYGRAPFESFKIVIDAGADINLRMGYPCYGRPLTLLLRARQYRRDSRDSLKKFAYLVEHGANTNVYDELDHGYLIDYALYSPFYEELALIVNSGTNITRLSGNLMYGPNLPFYLTGILIALLIRNDVINDEIFEQLISVPPDAMQRALERLAQLVHEGQVPHEVAENAANRSFQNFRRLIVGVLGKDEAVKAVIKVREVATLHRRSHLLSGALEGGVRQKMGATRFLTKREKRRRHKTKRARRV